VGLGCCGTVTWHAEGLDTADHNGARSHPAAGLGRPRRLHGGLSAHLSHSTTPLIGNKAHKLDGMGVGYMHTEALFLATSREGMGRGRPQRAWELFCYEQRMPIMYVCMYAAVAELAPDSRNGKGEGAGKDLVRSHLFGACQPIGPRSLDCKRVMNCKGPWMAPRGRECNGWRAAVAGACNGFMHDLPCDAPQSRERWRSAQCMTVE
jgi:hypothetical protein